MPEDASLDDFAGPGGDDEGGDDGGLEESDGDANGEEGEHVEHVGALEEGDEDGVIEADAVDPAVATSRSVPAGRPCSSCETVVTRLWSTDGEELCADCKSW